MRSSTAHASTSAESLDSQSETPAGAKKQAGPRGTGPATLRVASPPLESMWNGSKRRPR
jgi:hypothetical protein